MTHNSTHAARLVPPIGAFQDIDGRRLFIHRAGSGGPAVVFLPGASAVGLDYFGVQQEISRFTTAVIYDRGGTGYSDRLPLPRTAAAVAVELRDLLRAQHIAGPYVLAAHSLGGFYAHRFAQLYPREVAGLVWLDALHHDWDAYMPASASLAAAEHAGPGLAELEQMRPMLRDIHSELLAAYPEHLRQPLVRAKLTTEWLRAGLAERSGLAELAAELRGGPGLPDVPTIALSVVGTDPAERDRIPASTVQQLHDGRRRMDAARAAAAPQGEQRIVDDTVHHRLCFDRPDAVVRAVADVIDRATRP
ncbi:alpha/beta fold hydrolase [Nocardia cyriacigeorgica]|uniref:alpha/beta fold hydrolase n=1 Tax=Nocardia cyriacigeorgica TaxID=135487 RepID=UPI0013CF796E|nr:alpha/beta hydrolase [Nocardia cyriacigeorgica]NEW26067.1 alpha/beta hydrolase [Nocardia cyriacigeorgica]